MKTWTQPNLKIIPQRKIEESDYYILLLLKEVGTTHEYTSGGFQDWWMEFIHDEFDTIDLQHMKEQVQSIESNKMFEFVCSVYRMKYNVKLNLWFKDLYEEFSL